MACPSRTSIERPRTSSRQGTSSVSISWITQFGVTRAKWTATARASGPLGLCGAIAIECVSAIAAILRASQRPPQWERCGWMTWHALRSISSRNWLLPTSRSPVAIGIRRR